jgi:hypothetical protein
MAGQPAAEQLGVVVHTSHAVVRGEVDVSRIGRLSELLNNVSLAFFPVLGGEVRPHGVAAWGPRCAQVTINKTDILFAYTTAEATRPRMSGLVVEKRPLVVSMYVGPFQVHGAFHVLERVAWQEWLTSQRLPFLPMTEVSFALPAQQEAETNVPFLAVNRQHISMLYEM